MSEDINPTLYFHPRNEYVSLKLSNEHYTYNTHALSSKRIHHVPLNIRLFAYHSVTYYNRTDLHGRVLSGDIKKSVLSDLTEYNMIHNISVINDLPSVGLSTVYQTLI